MTTPGLPQQNQTPLLSVPTTPKTPRTDGTNPKRATKTMPAPSRNPQVGQRPSQPQQVNKARPFRDPRGFASDQDRWANNDPASEEMRERTARGLRSYAAGIGGGLGLVGAGAVGEGLGRQVNRAAMRGGGAPYRRGAQRLRSAGRGAKYAGGGVAVAGIGNAARHLRRLEGLDEDLPDGVLPEDIFDERVGKASRDVTDFYGNGTERGEAENVRTRRSRGRGESRGAQSVTNVPGSRVPRGVRRVAAATRGSGPLLAGGAIGAGYVGWARRSGDKAGRKEAVEESRNVQRNRRLEENIRQKNLSKALEDKERFDSSDVVNGAVGAATGGYLGYRGERFRRLGNEMNSVADSIPTKTHAMAQEALRMKNAAGMQSNPVQAEQLRDMADHHMNAAINARGQAPAYRKAGRRAKAFGKPAMVVGAATPVATVYGNQRRKKAYNQQAAIEREKLGITKSLRGPRDLQVNSNIPSGSRRGRRVTE